MRLDKSRTYYISGPCINNDGYSYIVKIEKLLSGKGFIVKTGLSEKDINNIVNFDVIIMLNGWERCSASRAELSVALDAGMPVICESDLYTHNVIGRIAVESES